MYATDSSKLDPFASGQWEPLIRNEKEQPASEIVCPEGDSSGWLPAQITYANGNLAAYMVQLQGANLQKALEYAS